MRVLANPPTQAPTSHSWLYRKTVTPVITLLRQGTTPERLAWSLAIGVAVGINPVLGSTTVACLAIAFLCRVNLVASQITNHLVYPLQLALFLPFLHLGTRIFRSPPIPLSPHHILHLARRHPWELTRHLWLWECHALVAWLLVATLVAPLLAAAFTPLLRRFATHIACLPPAPSQG